MHRLLLSLADVEYAACIIYLSDTMVALMEVVLKTVQFVKEYLGKASIGWSNSKKKKLKTELTKLTAHFS